MIVRLGNLQNGQPEVEVRSGDDRLDTTGPSTATITIRQTPGYVVAGCGLRLEECEQLGDLLCRIASQAGYKR